jgi:long-chain acyl-CoA synthetase
MTMHARGGPRPDPGTLTQLFFTAAERFDKVDALQVRVDDRYRPISHRTMVERVRHLCLGLQTLGYARGDRVAILSENRPEWSVTDFACLTGCLADVPIYPSLPADQLPHIINDSGAIAIVVSSREQAEKIVAQRANMPGLRHLIAMDQDAAAIADLSFDALVARGAALDSPAAADRWKTDALTVAPDDLATLIYTSGTTGAPKGVMLSHDNLYSNVTASARAVEFSTNREVALSFLPLSHVFGRMGDYLMFHIGASIAYVPSFDLVPTCMLEARPTIAMSVPRLYEKMYARVLESALAGGAVSKRVFFWARAVADRWADQALAGRTPRGPLAWQYALAQKLVFSKLRQRTGGRMRYFVSGGAPLAPEINKFFFAAGLTILEGYGLTETSPVIGVNTPTHFRIGTVGRPIDGVEIRIAEDGEILTRGPHVMKGYWHNEKATHEAIDDDGWFRTGDIGEIDDGYLRITDRKKDLIVTAGGKNIAPQPIENKVKTNKFVAEAVMIGDRRKFPSLLVVPNFDQLEKWGKHKQLSWSDRAALLKLPEVQAKMEKEVGRTLEGLAHFETPKKVALLEHEFSVENGELTPTLKVKRRVIDERFKALIDGLYADGGESTNRHDH